MRGRLRTSPEALTAAGVADAWGAWDFSQRISPTSHVQAMRVDAYGELVANDYSRPYPVRAGSPAAPWAVRLAGEDGKFYLLAFDFDGEDATERFDQVDAFVGLLRAAGIEFVVCRSSTSDRRHVWVGVDRAQGAPAGLVSRLGYAGKAAFSVLDHGMLSNPRNGACRPPLSPHRDGSSSVVLQGSLETLLYPSTTPAQLEQLLERLYAIAPEEPAIAATAVPGVLPRGGRRELTTAGHAFMDAPGGGMDPSRNGYQALLAAANAGWDYQDVLAAVRTAPGLEHFRTQNTGQGRRRRRRPGEAEHRLARAWANAMARAALNQFVPAAARPPSRDEAGWADFEASLVDVSRVMESFRVNPGRWGGRHGDPSNRSVLMALAFLTLRTGKRIVAAADRDVAELAGISHSTAAEALLRLQADGFIRRAREHQGTHAAQWELVTRPGHLSTATDLGRTLPRTIAAPPAELFNIRRLLLEEIEQHLADLRHDVFTYQGLGHHAGRLFALLRGGDTVELHDAATRLGISTLYAARVLSAMVSAKILVKRGNHWVRTLRNVLHRAAERLGVNGVLERRRERFTMERIRWRWWLDHLAARYAPTTRRSPRPVVEQPTLVFFDAQAHDTGVYRYPHRAGNPGRPDHRAAGEDVYAGLVDHLYRQTAA